MTKMSGFQKRDKKNNELPQMTVSNTQHFKIEKRLFLTKREREREKLKPNSQQ